MRHPPEATPWPRVSVAWIVLAALTRVVAGVVLGDRIHFIDEALYIDAARALLAGNGFGHGYANVPAQPVFLAVLAAPWPRSLVLVRCGQGLVTGLVGGAVLRALGRRTFGPAATRVALALWALDPLVVVAGALLYPDAIGAVVLAGALLATVAAAHDDRYLTSTVAGALLGLTVLFRPVAVVLIPVLAAWGLVASSAARARRWRHALCLVTACGLAIAPWVLRNLAHEGHVVPSAMPGLQGAPVPVRDIDQTGLGASLGRELWHNPGPMMLRIGRELTGFWELYPTRLQTDDPEVRASMHREDARVPVDSSFPPALRDVVSAVTSGLELALALGGLAIAWRTQRLVAVLLVAVAFMYGLGYALFVAKLRYRIVVLPGVFLLSGVGATALAGVLSVRRSAVGAAVGRDAASGSV